MRYAFWTDASKAQNDLQLHFPDSKPSTYPKKIKLPTGVAVNVEPGQSIHIGANGELITAPSSSSALVKGHEAPYGGGEGVSITMTDQAATPKLDKNTLSTANKAGYSGPLESVPINPKVSGLVALLQKTVADGHFRHPMDKDMPIEQIQVKLRNGTRYFYAMSRDVTGVEHSLKGLLAVHNPGSDRINFPFTNLWFNFCLHLLKNLLLPICSCKFV